MGPNINQILVQQVTSIPEFVYYKNNDIYRKATKRQKKDPHALFKSRDTKKPKWRKNIYGLNCFSANNDPKSTIYCIGEKIK